MGSYNTIIQGLSKTFNGLLPLREEFRKKLDNKFRLEFNFNSNNLEGNTLTYGETELLLIFDETRNAAGHKFREYEEMKAHDIAYALIREWATDGDRPLTEANIKNLNEVILVRPFWKDAITLDGQQTRRQIRVGDYKEYPNSVRLANGEIFQYTTPQDTPIEMGELIDWYQKEEQEGNLSHVELAALLHYKFVRIHPFDDGNGRISRLLMNYVTFRHSLPPIIIKSIDKPQYLRALHDADTGNIQAFIDYVAEQSIWSLELGIKAAKGESIDEIGDLDKKIALLKRRIGEGPNDIVTIKKGARAVADIYQAAVMPLASEWERRLKSFDTFFFNRLNTIRIDQETVKGGNLDELAEDLLKTRFTGSIDKGMVIGCITIRVEPKGLRKGGRDISINGGEIQFHFLENSYEIRYIGNNLAINKLYHQIISKEEIAAIAEHLGTWLYDFLETEFARNG